MAEPNSSKARVTVLPNGPYRVTGLPLVHFRRIFGEEGEGHPTEWERGPETEAPPYDVCRCGHSKTKPFCDGSEWLVGFDGTETADRSPSAERRRQHAGEGAVLSDDRVLCSRAGFCVKATTDAWELAEKSGDPARLVELAGTVAKCPSGRLTYRLAPGDGDDVEEELPQEAGVIEGGPLWVRGGVPVESADGFVYEVRNRVTLCRCGRSSHKPFCDGSHRDVEDE
jgi:CDGSH-type Zn-finger protein